MLLDGELLNEAEAWVRESAGELRPIDRELLRCSRERREAFDDRRRRERFESVGRLGGAVLFGAAGMVFGLPLALESSVGSGTATLIMLLGLLLLFPGALLGRYLGRRYARPPKDR